MLLKGFTDKMDAYLGQQNGFNAGMKTMLPGGHSAEQAYTCHNYVVMVHIVMAFQVALLILHTYIPYYVVGPYSHGLPGGPSDITYIYTILCSWPIQSWPSRWPF